MRFILQYVLCMNKIMFYKKNPNYFYVTSSVIYLFIYYKSAICAEDKNLEDLDCSHSEDYNAATAERCIIGKIVVCFVLLIIQFVLNALNVDFENVSV